MKKSYQNNKLSLVEAYANLGNLLQDYGLFKDAVVNYEKALEYLEYIESNMISDNIGSLDEIAAFYQKKLEKFITLNDYKKYESFFINRRLFDEKISRIRTSKKSILIPVCVFNRKKITQLSLAQIKRYKTEYCYLQVYNDQSTEYDNYFLEQYADEVIQLPHRMGPHNLRWCSFNKFLESDFDFMYMTDNDIIHDPEFINALEYLYEMGVGQLPVCLYNSRDHSGPKTVLFDNNNGIILKKTAPGFSMFYDRKMVEKVISIFDKTGTNHDNYGWDYRAIAYLGLPWITSEVSYLEHYGAGGVNNSDYETDRAINPSEYLQKRRESILNYLIHDIRLDIVF